MTSNESILSILLAISLCAIAFQSWRNSLLEKIIAEGPKKGEDLFTLVSAIIEQERSRISSELHDELGTLLSIIYLDLELVMHEAAALTPYGENRLLEIRRNLNLVIESIRTNIWNLSAQMFDQLDIAFSIRELCHKLDRYKGTHVVFVQSGSPFAISEKFKLNLFRITQELLTNAIKHSSAWNISVHLHWDADHQLSITVEDDGVHYTNRKNRDGLGMLNIAKRAEHINALIKREPLPKGHRVILSVKTA